MLHQERYTCLCLYVTSCYLLLICDVRHDVPVLTVDPGLSHRTLYAWLHVYLCICTDL